MLVIKVNHLQKRYRDHLAVRDISFTVEQGEIFGIIGPNGAGKTTTVECIEGLRIPDQETVRIWGLDPQRDQVTLRSRIGVQLQQSQFPEKIKVREILDLYRFFYRAPANWRMLIEEVERLCDRVAVTTNGRIAAIDTPGGLVSRTHGEQRQIEASEFRTEQATLDDAFLMLTNCTSDNVCVE